MITFIIPGTPVGKPRQTQRDKWAQRDCVLRYRAWADRARRICRPLPPMEAITDVSWTAYFAFPASYSKKKRTTLAGQLHRQKPDRDNIDKAVLDALFHDDKGIAAGTIRKVWCSDDPRLELMITTKGANEHG